MILAAFQLLSLGILDGGASNTITAAVTLTTADGGEPKDFNSVRLFLFSVFRASCAAASAGSALAKSSSHDLAFSLTSFSMTTTFFSSSSAMAFSLLTFSVSTPTFSISLSASSFFCFSSTSWDASLAFRSSTWEAVLCSFSRPFSRRSVFWDSSSAFFFNRLRYSVICSARRDSESRPSMLKQWNRGWELDKWPKWLVSSYELHPSPQLTLE